MSNILIVDDLAMNRAYLAALLSVPGYRTLEAADAIEALQILGSESVDLVISDILMPSTDGYEFVYEVRSDPSLRKIPVVFYTAHYLEQEARSLARACGVAHIITKPGDSRTILATVETVLKEGTGALPPFPPPGFDSSHRRLLASKLAAMVGALQAANSRLSSLLDLGRQLVLERDPSQVLATYCEAARQIVGARYAAVGMTGERGGELTLFRTCGMGARNPERAAPLLRGLLATLLGEARPLRLRDLSVDPETLGFEEGHPPLKSFLGVPIASPSRLHGFLYLADRLAGDPFGAEDERVAVMLAAQVAVVYENAALYSQLQHRTAELRRSNAELEQFAYLVSHDLEEPLRMVTSYVQLLEKRNRDRLDPDSGQFMAFIIDGAKRARSMIKDLLAYSRVGGGSAPKEPIDWEAVLVQTTDNLRAAIEESGAVLTWDPLPDVLADPMQVRQLLQNLVGNAIKFRRTDEVPRMHLSARRTGSEWVFSIRDNGIGIEAQHIKRLFVMFQRMHDREEYPGTGMGLAISRKIVEQHGGRIWAESEPGKGSTFLFTLPPAPT